MNRTATYPLPIGGKIYLKGYDKPLPPQVAAAICGLGNLPSENESKLHFALKSSGVTLSISELRSILVANNGLSPKEASSLASSFLAER